MSKVSSRQVGKVVEGVPCKKRLIGLCLCLFSSGLAGCVTADSGYEDAVSGQLAAGYEWKQLEKCRPPKEDALALPIIINGATKLVCGTLVPSKAASRSTSSAGEGQNTANFDGNTALKQSDASSSSSTTHANSTTATLEDAGNSGVLWVIETK
jgi:hypothetical protein